MDCNLKTNGQFFLVLPFYFQEIVKEKITLQFVLPLRNHLTFETSTVRVVFSVREVLLSNIYQF